MANISEALVELNPWWKGPFEPDYKERELYAQLEKYLRLRQVIALTGLRRVGKTTLLYKIVGDAIRAGFDPRSVLYFSFDEFRQVHLRDVLKAYEALLGRNLPQGKYLVLFDEVQKVEGWPDQLKALYDAHANVKFVVSGSESLFIRRKSRETLAGRLFEFQVEPLTLREYLAFKGVAHTPTVLHEQEIVRTFEEYVRTQGFPELVGVRDAEIIRKYLRESIVEKIVYRDLPTLVSIRDPVLLESLLNILMEEPGQLVQINELAQELGIARKTLSNYLSYLEQAFLVRKLYNYSTGRRKVERKLRKYYPTVVSVALLFRDDDASRGRALEWVVVNQMRAEYFWRDPYQNEVDVVVAGKKPVPVEIKSGRVNTAGLEAFVRKFKVDRGLVVTRDTEGSRRVGGATITLVPVHRHLLGRRVTAE